MNYLITSQGLASTILIILCIAVLYAIYTLFKDKTSANDNINNSNRSSSINRFESKPDIIDTTGMAIKMASKSASKFINDSTNKYKKNLATSIKKHYLTSFAWVWITPEKKDIQAIFRENNELLLTREGNVVKWHYDLISQDNSIILSSNDKTIHYNISIVNNDYFFMNRVGTTQVFVFANQNKYQDSYRSWFIDGINEFKDNLAR